MILHLHGEAGEPATGSILENSQSLDLPLERTVLLDPDDSDVVHLETVVSHEGETSLREAEGVVPIRPLEAGVSGIDSGLASLPEGLKSQLNPLTDGLQDLGVNDLEGRSLDLPLGDHGIDVVESEGGPVFLVGIPSGLEDVVVQPTTFLQDELHLGSLPLGWKQSELESLDHHSIPPFDRLYQTEEESFFSMINFFRRRQFISRTSPPRFDRTC